VPEDSILDVVNNDQALYDDLQALYQRWYLLGDRWNRKEAMIEAVSRATFYANAIGQGHGRSHIQKAAREMIEEFRGLKDYHARKLREAAQTEAREAELHRIWDSSLPTDKAEQARRYDQIARKAGFLILREVLKDFLPVSKEQLRSALARGDFDLGSIPYEVWLRAAEQIPYLPGRGLDMVQKIELLKHFARWHYGV
jgi:hypothetical protein